MRTIHLAIGIEYSLQDALPDLTKTRSIFSTNRMALKENGFCEAKLDSSRVFTLSQ